MHSAKANRIKWLKAILLTFGIVLTLSGFYLDNWEHSAWLVRGLAPRYFRAMTAYERMLSSGSEIGPADPGFAEIAAICSEQISGGGDLTIARIKIKEAGSLAAFGSPIAQNFSLEVTLKDGRSATGYVKDLRPLIRERFLDNPLFRLGELFVWLGVGITALSFVVDRFTA